MALPLLFKKSKKYPGRGKPLFDGKLDNFDAFDEVWSQWMLALRKGQIKTYIPESLLPRDPKQEFFFAEVILIMIISLLKKQYQKIIKIK